VRERERERERENASSEHYREKEGMRKKKI